MNLSSTLCRIHSFQPTLRNILEVGAQKFPSSSFDVIGPLAAANPHRSLHTTPCHSKSVTARYRPTKDQSLALTYEMANPPHMIAHRKSWNSWNTCHLIDGKRRSETTIDDMFIRKFMTGTWHNLFVSEIIIKRQFNMVRIAGLVHRRILPRKMYFLIGYTEEILAYWLKCPVKLELQTVEDNEDVVYKYI